MMFTFLMSLLLATVLAIATIFVTWQDKIAGAFFTACAAVFTVFLIVGGYAEGYRDGQIDAIKGAYHYQRAETADGRVRYLKLNKPTTRPGEVTR